MEKAKYFAYGSNMSLKRINKRISSVDLVGVGKLKDYEFICNKRSIDGSAKANIEFNQGSYVWGVIFELNKSELYLLDKIEGGYKRKEVTIKMSNDKISVYTYISENIKEDMRVLQDYKDIIIKGAKENDLPKKYINKLERNIKVKK